MEQKTLQNVPWSSRVVQKQVEWQCCPAVILLPRPLAAATGIRRPCNYIDAVSRTNTASSRSSNLFCGRYQRFHHGRAGLFLFKSFSKCFSRYFLRKKVSWEAILASTLSYWMFYESFAQYFKSSTLDGAAPFTGFRYFHFIFLCRPTQIFCYFLKQRKV